MDSDKLGNFAILISELNSVPRRSGMTVYARTTFLLIFHSILLVCDYTDNIC